MPNRLWCSSFKTAIACFTSSAVILVSPIFSNSAQPETANSNINFVLIYRLFPALLLVCCEQWKTDADNYYHGQGMPNPTGEQSPTSTLMT